VKALNPFSPFWYTPPSEEGVEKPTKFKIRGLDGTQMGYVQPEMLFEGPGGLLSGLTGKGLEAALDYGLLDWESFENDAGPIAFHKVNFKFIPFSMQAELATQIVAASWVNAAQKKTS